MGFEINICNLALGRVNGSNPIKSFTELSREAIQCNIFYDQTRNFCLAEYDWPFCRRTDVMELTAETDLKYAYVYRKPENCLTARKIYNPNEESSIANAFTLQGIQSATNRKIPFDQGVSSTGNFSVIMTNEAGASLVYTSKVFNDSVFPPKFVDALAWRLASELAVPLKGSTSLADDFAKRFAAAISSAGVRAANEEYSEPVVQSDLADSRL